MRSIAPLALVACLATLALAALPASAKTSAHVGRHPAPIDRQGGDTIAQAVELALPFVETGSTAGFADDYDEACPYAGSTSPDVVYTFVPVWDAVTDFDMLGSTYDTKIYLYDEDLNLVACNDDYYPDYVSLIENVYLDAGMRYYLVIDGYGGDSGEYVVSTCDWPPCDFGCGGAMVTEGEPPLHDGYVDHHNGGCDTEPPVFQRLELPEGETVLEFCAVTGWYDTGGPQRDSDWFEVEAAGHEVSVWVHAPYTIDIVAEVMYVQDCENVSTLPYQLSTCGSGTIQIPTTPGELVLLRVQPQSPTRTPCSQASDEYELYFSGLAGPVAVEEASWSAVRALYR